MSRPARTATCLALLAVALLALVGCGGGDDGDGGLAGVAPPDSVLFVDANVRPSGDLATRTVAFGRVVGQDGDLVAELLGWALGVEGGDREQLSALVAPWLGERAAAFYQRLDGDEPSGRAAVFSVSDSAGAEEFVERQLGSGARVASHEGVEYRVGRDGGVTLGLVDGVVVSAENARTFKAVVEAAAGDSLADQDIYREAIEGATPGSLADIYIDVAGLVERGARPGLDQAVGALGSAGIDAADAAVVASVNPELNRLEVEISGGIGTGDTGADAASELLASLPADSQLALAVSGFGDELREAIEDLDREGIPGTVGPGQLKVTLSAAGIDLTRLVAAVEDAALFVEGEDEESLRGALILTTDGTVDVEQDIDDVARLFRNTGSAGVRFLGGGVSGFSIRDEAIGAEPAVVVAAGKRVVIGYGAAAALRGARVEKGPSLAGTEAYEEAVDSLGGLAPVLFARGLGVARLAAVLAPGSEDDLADAESFLSQVTSIAIAPGGEDDSDRAKMVVNFK